MISEDVGRGGEVAVVLVGLEVDAVEMRFSPDAGERVRSTSFHQSISTTFLMPHSLNHFFRPKPTTNWALGWFLWSSRTVGWERWSAAPVRHDFGGRGAVEESSYHNGCDL